MPPVCYAMLYKVTDAQWMRNDTHGPRAYQTAVGGPCAQLDPPAGYWCSASPARAPDGSLSHRHPSGLNYSGVLPHAPYAAPENATVVACNTANCWFTWAFGGLTQDKAKQTLSWSRGGFQGAEGFDDAGIWCAAARARRRPARDALANMAGTSRACSRSSMHRMSSTTTREHSGCTTPFMARLRKTRACLTQTSVL